MINIIKDFYNYVERPGTLKHIIYGDKNKSPINNDNGLKIQAG